MTASNQNILPVRLIGDRVLRIPAASVAEITDEIRTLARQMIATMYAFDGIGLAAPQIGRSLRLVTLGLSRKPDSKGVLTPGEALLLPQMPLALLNPRIVDSATDTTMREEGCLSVPNIYGHVERPAQVVIEAELCDGSTLKVECGGLLACCLQHEIDHLNGVLFVKKVIPDEQYEVRRQVSELKLRSRKTNYLRLQS